VVGGWDAGRAMVAMASKSRLLTQTEAERRAAMKVVGWQALITLATAGLAAMIGGARAGGSALLGGTVAMAATLVLIVGLFRHRDGTPAARVAWGFFVGWGLKVALTIGLLYVAFRSRNVVPVALLAGYAATFAAYWLAPRGPVSIWR